MATLILDGKKGNVPDGSKMIDTAKKLGVIFSCENGICRTCEISVKKGIENLSSPTDQETFARIRPPQRLACQCRILKGTVEIAY